jgi:hypothetical protein
MDLAGKQIDTAHVGVLRQRARKFDHVFGLAAGVGIATQLETVTADESVNTYQGEIQAIFDSDGLVLPVVDELLIKGMFGDGGATVGADSGSEFSGTAQCLCQFPLAGEAE